MSLPLQSVPFSVVLASIVKRVSDALALSTDFIRPVANDDYEIDAIENMFARIRPYGPSPIDATNGAPFGDQGAGRRSVTVGRRIRIYLYTRSGEDTVGGDEVALGGYDPNQTIDTPPSTPGQFIAEELILNALHDFFPVNANNVPVTIGPMHWLDSADGPPERKKEDSEGLIRSHLDFQVVYILSIQSIEPAPVALPEPIQAPV